MPAGVDQPDIRVPVFIRILCAVTHKGYLAAVGLPFPSIPTTRPVAIATLNERVKTVVNFSACSREGDYLTYRTEMRGDGSPFAGTELAGNYKHEGEDLTSILIAKIAWVRSNPDNAASTRFSVVITTVGSKAESEMPEWS